MDETTGPHRPTPASPAAGQTPLVQGPAHLMTALPHLLGYRPGHSLVVVATAVETTAPGRPGRADRLRGRMAMTTRADLAGPDDLDQAVELLAGPVARLRRRHGHRLVLHCFLWDADEELGRLAAARLGPFADAHEVALNDLVLVGTDAYLPLVEAGEPVQDGRWRPLPSPADVPLVADLVLRGRGVAPGRDDAVAVVRARDEETSRATEAALREVAPGELDGLQALGALGRWVAGGSFAGPPTPRELAAVTLVLQDRTLRDVVLARWLPQLFTLDDLLEPSAVELVEDLLPAWPGDDGEALGRLIALAGQVPLDLSVPFVTLAGLVAWGTGEGTLANEAADLALELEPDYRMAQLLRQALEHGLPPDLGVAATDAGARRGRRRGRGRAA
ncbi:DUF4192 domain-containing protein [Ornithinimicrobium kibberense]|uniref:DUF4192 domain-containing protein n=2 Tax=Ornithinimicrobium kibberense TaxID=282060 RepID=A0ABV5V2X4_9MICO|nr:DUF4192 domain-containing protein [Ornithinimicrobium kibberense]